MESILRPLLVYGVLLLIFRIAGKRSLAQITTFDFVLLLIISESISNALQGEGYSLTNAVLIVITLLGLDIGLSLVKRGRPRLAQLLEGVPLVVVENGRPLKELMEKARVDEDDILSAARERQGLERLDQIKYAVVETTGMISVVPMTQE